MVYEDASISPVLDKDGNIINFVAVKRDVTKEIETDRRLQQAQKMEAIGNLAGGIAHDFNNVLASIIGYTELAIDEAVKGSVQEDNLQEVYAAGKRAKELVRQILVFARQSNHELKPVQVDLIAKEVMKLIRSTIPATIEIRQNIDSNSLILADPTRIHQVLMNLCTNAVDAMEDGGILSIELQDQQLMEEFTADHSELCPGEYIKLTISDTGCGIPAELVDSIFEPYFTTKGVSEGTGLGLSTVYGIVKQYNGDIFFETEMNSGSIFTIYLPITKKRKKEKIYKPKNLPTGKENILLVDDEASITKMTNQILSNLGYNVTIKTSPIEALELFKSKLNEFDLVITDMTMPSLTGDKLAAEILKIKPDIPIILCTGYSKKVSDQSAAEIGIKAFAYKPMVKADLAKTVRKVLDEAKSKSQE